MTQSETNFVQKRLPKWDLQNLYASPDSPDLQRDLIELEHKINFFVQKWKDKLDVSLKKNLLGKAIYEYERIQEGLGLIHAYAYLLYAEDVKHPKNLKFYGDTQEKIIALSSLVIFFPLEINALQINLLEVSSAIDLQLKHYYPWILDLRNDKPYQLDPALETLFHEKSITSYAAWNRLFDETLAALQFNIDGQILSIESALNKFVSTTEKIRELAFKALTKTFQENQSVFTLITNTLIKDKEISDRWRGFKDVAASRHHNNRIEPEVVNTMVSVVQSHFPKLSHRYYKLKSQFLGKTPLDIWDRNAPLSKTDDVGISWETAKSTVLKAYEAFSPQMAAIATKFFTNNWIDAELRPSKSTGAFAHPTVPSKNPYILLNYMGRPRDVMTLAHELGHGIHQILSADQGLLMASAPLPLAETASVFGEMITFQSLLKQAKTSQEKYLLLAQKIEDMLNTVVRQTSFYMFERDIHQLRKNGELTTSQINNLWLKNQKLSLGDSIRLNDGYESFWVYIPHFIHSPFYVYAYAFGDCLVNSLYAIYKKGNSDFEKLYLDLLKSGSSQSYDRLLSPFGFDLKETIFWENGLSVISNFIDMFEEIQLKLDNENSFS